jgi:hypothetical protein
MSIKDTTPKIPAILRPSSGSSGHATMIWVPGVELVELVYQGGELKYVVWDGASVKYQKSHQNYTPPQWVADAVKKGTVRLPSQATASGGLDDIASRMKSFIHRYFECDEDFENLAVLWALHTWVYERFRATPYLRFLGSWGTGKSRATEVVGAIAYRPVALTGSSSPAALYRIIEPIGGTLLIDEADYSDTQVGTEVAKILNSGYQQGGCVWKTEKNTNGEFVPTAYDVYGPKIINGRKAFRDDATESRCLLHRPKRKTRQDIPVQLPGDFYTEAENIRNQLLDWRMRSFEKFHENEASEICKGLEGWGLKFEPRSMQIAGPLITVALRLHNGGPLVSSLIQFVKDNERQFKEVLRESNEAMLIAAYATLAKNGKHPTCSEISAHVIESKGGEDPELQKTLCAKRVGVILRELGFTTSHGNRGSEASIDSKTLEGLCQKFGINSNK